MTEVEMVSLKCKYDSGYAYFRTRLVPIPVILFSLVFLFVASQFSGNPVFDTWTGLYFVLLPFACYLFLNLYPEISVENEKIKLKFTFKELNISFDDIVNVVELDPMGELPYLRVDVKLLSLVHSIAGFVYGSMGKPSFLIRQDITNYLELRKLIILKTGVNLKTIPDWR